ESPMVDYLRGLRAPQMPKGNPPLSEEELHVIRSWILAGAKDDSERVAAREKEGSAPGTRRSTPDTASTKESLGFDPKTLGALANDPAMQKALNTLLFSSNDEEKFFARRALRLPLVPKAPEPPKVKGPAFNPIDQFIVA